MAELPIYARSRPALDKALGSSEVWCVNVVLDPAVYRHTGTMSMAI